jgi:hypothetical protein
MSGQTIGAIGGAIVGLVAAYFSFGTINPYNAAMLGAAIGGAVGGMLDQPKGPNLLGPRLQDLGQQTATYGAFLPRIYSKPAVFGNVFWIENNKLKEVATTETAGGKGSMTPESSQTTFAYYGTFALGLSEGLDPALYGAGAEVILSKMWIAGKLWYNRATTDEETILTSIDKELTFKFYSGTESQMPDPRMEAAVGVANCPAYRGRAYIVFYDFPLRNYGNDIAGVQVKAELTTSGYYDVYPIHKQNLLVDRTTHSGAVYNDYLITITSSANRLYVYDVSDLTNMFEVYNVSSLAGQTDIAVYAGHCYVTTGTGRIIIYNLANPVLPIVIRTVTTAAGAIRIVIKNNYAYVVCNTAGLLQIYDISTPISTFLVGSASIPTSSQNVDVDGNYAYVAAGTLIDVRIFDITNKSAPIQISQLSGTNNLRCILAKGNYVYGGSNPNKIIVYDVSNKLSPSFLNVQTTGEPPNNRMYFVGDFLYVVRNTGFGIYSLTNPALPVFEIATTDGIGFGLGGAISEDNKKIFYIHGNATTLLGSIHSYVIPITLNFNDVSLGSIVNIECLRSNLLLSGDIDTSLLTQTVRGYRVSSQGAIRAAIEPLQGAWPFDVIQDGYKIKYVPRGGANVATIPYTDLDAREAGANPGVELSTAREMASVLPRKVSLKYFDAKREYDTGEQSYERINTDAVNVIEAELPIVFTAPEAAGKAQTLLYLYWMERYDFSFKLPPTYQHLQPADIITLTMPDATYNLRLRNINYTQDGRLECQAKLNRSAIYSPSALGEEGIEPDDTLSPTGESAYEFLDIPLLQDVYNIPGYPIAMTGTKKGWPGGVISRSDDDGFTYNVVQGVSSPGTIMGTATNTIQAHDGKLLDKSSVLNVTLTMPGATLSSITELAMFNGANHFAYGVDNRWEIIAAQTCVLQGDGSYQLSDLMRGRFGTEQFTGTHAVNDTIALLSSSSLAFVSLTSAMIGLNRKYKGVNVGATLSSVTEKNFIYEGVNLKPLSPVYLNGNRDPSTFDWTLTWVRRGRVNNEWKDSIDVPVGEATESYEIEIYSNGTYTTVQRTITGLTSATASYTSAEQVFDFGSNQASLYLKIFQISATVGRGSPLQTSITR